VNVAIAVKPNYSRNSNGGWKLGRFSGKCDAGFREMASFVSNQFARPVNATPLPRNNRQISRTGLALHPKFDQCPSGA
jgi:hypothetical protein